VLGLQLEWQAGANTAFVLQGVVRAGDDLSPELRMAYLRQQVSNDFAVRAGRIRSPLYFDSDVVEIGYAYLMARPALPLYGTVNSVASLDGADLQWRHNIGDTALLAQAYYGQSDYRHRFYNLDPVQAADASLRNIRGLAVSATLPNLILRASHSVIGSYTMRSAQVSQINGATAHWPGRCRPAPPTPICRQRWRLQARAQSIRALASPFDSRPLYTSVGFDANAGDWRLLGEATRLDSRSAMVGKYHGYQFTVARSSMNYPLCIAGAPAPCQSALDTSALAPTGLDPMLDGGLAQLKAGWIRPRAMPICRPVPSVPACATTSRQYGAQAPVRPPADARRLLARLLCRVPPAHPSDREPVHRVARFRFLKVASCA
jgi:hypothetical protein